MFFSFGVMERGSRRRSRVSPGDGQAQPPATVTRPSSDISRWLVHLRTVRMTDPVPRCPSHQHSRPFLGACPRCSVLQLGGAGHLPSFVTSSVKRDGGGEGPAARNDNVSNVDDDEDMMM